MEKKINEKFIKISGKSPIENRDLELGQDVEIQIKGQVVQKTDNDNQNGTKDVVFTIKPLEVEVK